MSALKYLDSNELQLVAPFVTSSLQCNLASDFHLTLRNSYADFKAM